MRLLATVAGVVGLFTAVVYFGGGLLGVWDEIDAAPAASVSAASTAGSSGARPAKQRRAARKSVRKRQAVRDRRAPRERLVEADMAVARKAVLRLSDMERGGWLRAPISARAEPGCPGANPDASRFTITGTARSAFKGGESVIESRVQVFANATQAALYFDASFGRPVLRCIRDGVKRALQKASLRPRVAYARFQKAPPIGSQTAIYVVGYVLTLRNGTKRPYPVDVLIFRAGRAVGAVSFNFVPSDDGSRPCSCELEEARLVASRLDRA